MVLRIIYLLLLIGISLYFGLAGFTGADIHKSIDDLEKNHVALEKITIAPSYKIEDYPIRINNEFAATVVPLRIHLDKRFPFLHPWSVTECLILLSFSFGLLGGMIQLLIRLAYSKDKIGHIPFYLTPLLACLTGFVMFAITAYAPKLLNFDLTDSTKGPGIFIVSSLLGGIFTKKVFDMLQMKIFSKEDKN